MKRQINRLCILAGIGLLVAAAMLLISWQWRIHAAQSQVAAYVQTIRSLIPTPQGAALEERSDNTMSVLSVDGTDFIGILEMPGYDSALPVCGDWGNVTAYPSRLSGSVYDGSLQIGATSQRGQYDFYREISVGDAVYFMDMEGNRYAYEVADIRYEKHADQTALRQKDAPLTLFVKNIYAMEYILIFCNTQNG